METANKLKTSNLLPVALQYRLHGSLRHACPISFGLSPLPISYSPYFSSYYSLVLSSRQLSGHFSLNLKRRPTQCCTRHYAQFHYTQFLIFVVFVAVSTMAMMVGTTVVLPTVAPLSTMLLPTLPPLSAPTRFLFDAVNDLSKMYLNKKWTDSIKFHTDGRITP
jgi:hypothetical protein